MHPRLQPYVSQASSVAALEDAKLRGTAVAQVTPPSPTALTAAALCTQTATLRRPSCNRMSPRLQPYTAQATRQWQETQLQPWAAQVGQMIQVSVVSSKCLVVSIK